MALSTLAINPPVPGSAAGQVAPVTLQLTATGKYEAVRDHAGHARQRRARRSLVDTADPQARKRRCGEPQTHRQGVVLDLRSPLIWGSVPTGLAVGALAWALFGGAVSVAPRLSGYETRLAALDTRSVRRIAAQSVSVADALAHPLFSVGGVALTDATVLLEGLALTPRRAAALLSINGQPGRMGRARRDQGRHHPGTGALHQGGGDRHRHRAARRRASNDRPSAPRDRREQVRKRPRPPSSAVPAGYRLPPPRQRARRSRTSKTPRACTRKNCYF